MTIQRVSQGAAAQGPEIDTLQGWLEAWGEEVPSGAMDRMFLEMMIEHHEGALRRARFAEMLRRLR